jgi:citrate lyase beta subunit
MMKLCLITNKADFAREAEQAGVDRIMLDFERRGKAQRQAGKDLFLSDHRIEDVRTLRGVLTTATLVVRINALHDRSDVEIGQVIEGGADIVMLPYFRTIEDVRRFFTLVSGRARTILLVETTAAVENLNDIVDARGIDEIYIGLNDLSIALGRTVIFEPVCDGTVDRLAAILRTRAIPFGFGGIARLSASELPVTPEVLLAEQVRLGASLGWLGRGFRGDMETRRDPGELAAEIALLRRTIARWSRASVDDFRKNCTTLELEVSAWRSRMDSREPTSTAPFRF